MDSESNSPSLPPRPQEQLLIDLAPSLPSGRLLTNTVGRGQFAAAYAAQHPTSSATCWTLDFFEYHLLHVYHDPLPANLNIVCSADLPEEPYDIAALLVSARGNGELMRELLQQCALRLRDGGMLLAATDNPTDRWLGEQLPRLFGQIRRRPHPSGVVYQAVKPQVPKKLKHYDFEFPFRDQSTLLQLKTRPGVFSHREVDPGARALLQSMHIEPGARVLDIGCGSGVISLASAARGARRVFAFDANARAVECLRWSAHANNFPQIEVELDSHGGKVDAAAFDVAIANPPYFGNYSIAALFSQIASQALRPLGQFVVVTKTPQWYCDHLSEFGFGYIGVEPAKNYVIVRAIREPA